MDLNSDHVTAAAGGGLLAWMLTFFGHAFRFGGRLGRLENSVEAGFKALNEKLDILNKAADDTHARQDAAIEHVRESATEAHQRIDRWGGH